jgi:type IV pilus assembly protein PilA
MKSVKCPECGFVGWADAERCKKCGVIRLADPGGDAYEPSNGYYEYQTNDRYHYEANLKTGLAITALVIGIVDVFTLGMLGVGAILGIVLSLVALSKAKRRPSEYGGQGMATAGLVMSILSVVMIVPMGIVAAIAIPNLLASRRAANEGATMSALRTIHSAETTHQATYGNGSFTDLAELGQRGLISPELAQGKRYGYKFALRVKPDEAGTLPGFEVVAIPEVYGTTGVRSFYLDETGVLRAANNRGAPATEQDDPMDDIQYSSKSPPSYRYNRDY